MKKKVVSLVLMMMLALVVGGCTSVTTTPTGLSCTQYNHKGCYYFISNDKAVPCDIDEMGNNICKNTKGDFYFYSNGNTYVCASHLYCTGTKVSSPELCSPKFAYDVLADSGQVWEVVDKQIDQNTTQQPANITFTSTSATTISTSASIQITAYAAAIFGAIFASVRVQVNASVAKTVDTVVGNDFTTTVPAGVTAYGIYGVKVQATRGRLYQINSCGSSRPNYGDVETYVPIAPGWCVWLSGQTPCKTISG